MKAILPATKEEIDLWRRQFAGMHKHVVKMPVAQKVMYAYVLRMFATFTQLYRENEALRAQLDALRPVEVLPFGPEGQMLPTGIDVNEEETA
jgi:hypothetical protein